jgi:hypothetical protein
MSGNRGARGGRREEKEEKQSPAPAYVPPELAPTQRTRVLPPNAAPTNEWIDTIYSLDLFSQEELRFLYESIRYQSFDRNAVLYQLQMLNLSPRLTCEVIIVCALRGPQQASKVKLSNDKTLMSMGIPSSGQRGTMLISCQRITAATADLAAYYMKLINVPKRLQMALPGWLQFPSAGSIKLPVEYRQLHIEFSKQFSERIGGSFNEDIYRTMEDNSYYDDRLHLFN